MAGAPGLFWEHMARRKAGLRMLSSIALWFVEQTCSVSLIVENRSELDKVNGTNRKEGISAEAERMNERKIQVCTMWVEKNMIC